MHSVLIVVVVYSVDSTEQRRATHFRNKHLVNLFLKYIGKQTTKCDGGEREKKNEKRKSIEMCSKMMGERERQTEPIGESSKFASHTNSQIRRECYRNHRHRLALPLVSLLRREQTPYRCSDKSVNMNKTAGEKKKTQQH